MAPPWVLLERCVTFASGREATIGASSKDVETSTGVPSEEAVEIDDPSTAMAASLQAMKPDPDVSDPPEISHLSMVQQTWVGLPGGIISSTDKALVVLYAGHYQPGSPSSGCYLIYDASSNSLAAIPQLPDSDSFIALGLGAAILSRGEGAYVLAELVAANSGFPDGTLYLWRCPTLNQGQWIRKAVRLPRQVFAYAGSSVCWVDLLTGVLVCDLLKSPEPEFTFVPLPQGCSIDVSNGRRPRTKEFRSMGCVNGVIKFVAIVGYYENYDSKDLMLRSWTLSRDLKQWEAGTPLRVGDLWASESFRGRDLPQLVPSFPVVSVDEADVVYVVLNEVDRVPTADIFGDVCVEIVCKARYTLRIDTMQSKVLHSTKVIANDMTPWLPELLASEFSAYLEG